MEGDQFGDLGSVPPVIFSEHMHASGDVQLAVWRSGGQERCLVSVLEKSGANPFC